MTQPSTERSAVYAWQTAIAVAVVGTAAAVGLIVVFTYMDDYIGAFWSQAIYFLAFFAVVIAWLAALFTARVPDGLHRFLAAYPRQLGVRVTHVAGDRVVERAEIFQVVEKLFHHCSCDR